MPECARMCQSKFLLAITALATVLAAGQANAEKSLEDLLVEKGLISAEERDELGDAETEQKPEEKPQKKADADDGGLSNIAIRANHKGLSISTLDGAYTFAFGGRLQFDAGFFIEDESNLGDGTEVRRGRIKSYGTLAQEWDYKLEVNFDPDLSVPLTDGWLRYSGFKPLTVTVGHQKVPFSQQSMTSSNWQVFQERSLGDAFIDNEEQGRRRLGIVLGSYGDCWNLYGGAFTAGIADAGTDDEDWGFGSRGMFVPLNEKTRVFGIGASAIYRNFQGDSDLRIRARPGAHVSGTRLVDTGELVNARRNLMMIAEGTFVWDRFHAQGEYLRSWISRRRGRQNVVFDSWYVQAGVFLTGESRNFDIKSGKYKRPKPESSWGAWEIAVRFDGIDLTDGDVRGGRQRDITGGLNWWVNQNVMFRFNYIYADADPNSGVSLGDESEQTHAFSARAQVVF